MTKSQITNPKWFDMLTILNQVEGQIQNSKPFEILCLGLGISLGQLEIRN